MLHDHTFEIASCFVEGVGAGEKGSTAGLRRSVGALAIGADTDAENAAIGAAFQRAGFENSMSRTEYLLAAAALGS